MLVTPCLSKLPPPCSFRTADLQEWVSFDDGGFLGGTFSHLFGIVGPVPFTNFKTFLATRGDLFMHYSLRKPSVSP